MDNREFNIWYEPNSGAWHVGSDAVMFKSRNDAANYVESYANGTGGRWVCDPKTGHSTYVPPRKTSNRLIVYSK